jgi:hypothetical protein
MDEMDLEIMVKPVYKGKKKTSQAIGQLMRSSTNNAALKKYD